MQFTETMLMGALLKIFFVSFNGRSKGVGKARFLEYKLQRQKMIGEKISRLYANLYRRKVLSVQTKQAQDQTLMSASMLENSAIDKKRFKLEEAKYRNQVAKTHMDLKEKVINNKLKVRELKLADSNNKLQALMLKKLSNFLDSKDGSYLVKLFTGTFTQTDLKDIYGANTSVKLNDLNSFVKVLKVVDDEGKEHSLPEVILELINALGYLHNK